MGPLKAESVLLSSFFKQTNPNRNDLAPDSISGNYGNPVCFHLGSSARDSSEFKL